ncbi:MAG: UTP--glucose-1-phosphate uridylyltransferase GalU [Bacillota bacterium]
MLVHKAVIPAAGLGTRFLPATKAQPKEMIPIVDIPAIQLVVEEAVASGISDVLVITSRNKQAIEDHFDRSLELEGMLAARGRHQQVELLRGISSLARMHYVRQGEALGLGHAVLCARGHVSGEPFGVMLPDDLVRAKTPCLRQLLEVYHRTGRSVLALQRVPRGQLGAFGVIAGRPLGEGMWEVHDLVEKPHPDQAPSDLAVVGRYILEPGVFQALEETSPGVGGEIQLTDALRLMAQDRPLTGYEFSGFRYDVGDRMGFLKATLDYALESELGAQLAAHLLEMMTARRRELLEAAAARDIPG